MIWYKLQIDLPCTLKCLKVNFPNMSFGQYFTMYRSTTLQYILQMKLNYELL